MKKLCFNRKRLLRAIHAAAVALFLAATAMARAQTATADANGNVTITGSGTNYVYQGTNPTLAPGKTLTVSSGSTITNSNSQFVLFVGTNATNVNNGSLSVNYVPEGPGTVSAIYTTGSAAATTITNNGLASGATAGTGNFAAGIYYRGPGSATVSNTGTATGAGNTLTGTGSSSYGIDINSTAGTITITNAAGGTASATLSTGSANGTGISGVSSGARSPTRVRSRPPALIPAIRMTWRVSRAAAAVRSASAIRAAFQ
jgi:hypothetical protein